MNITAVVILYNSSLLESETLKSILTNKLNSIKLTLKIWNNGPKKLEDKDINLFLSSCSNLNIKVDIFQDIRNLSLSKIYNYFIKDIDYDYITILDQDSSLSEEFFEDIYDEEAEIIIPKIFSDINGRVIQTHPYEINNSEKIINEGFISEKIETVMSGITLSKNITNKIIEYRKYVFEEKLGFYGIDCDFFKTLNEMESQPRVIIYCKNKINHSFALLDPKESKSEFRQIELLYFKMFSRIEYQKKNSISTLWIVFRDFIRMKINFKKAYNLAIFALRKRHPRSIFNIDNHQPTHRI
ncbi:glycosyltransferase family 2 protein [Pectobacterium carotovorum]|uniref:glycosyltransferase family 2 protein n=1 Tax=Pectobacterium carotovorum TaxID=554 RepID=UPI002A80B3E2|nr:hypothetical protein [Pectobacterium carotovorum]MDY4373380.1 hypothetical protein [Pectobacterium carotovorum subsp. carotovorum]